MNKNNLNYSQITERPGLNATSEQIERLYQRYQFARNEAENKDILEVACGTGIGLTFLAQKATKVVGCDIDEENLKIARENIYKSPLSEKINIEYMDAHCLKYPDESFDIVFLFEALYYLNDPHKFFSEANRILRKNGKLILCSVNKDWEDFHPSPFTYQYFSVPDYYLHLSPLFNQINIFGGNKIENSGIKRQLLSMIKRISVQLNLIPKSLSARAYLKRIFIGKMEALPNELVENYAKNDPPVKINSQEVNKDYKIIYAVACKK